MGWNGYMTFGGTEIINVERTETYIADAGESWFRPLYQTDSISTLEEDTYNSAFVDPAPWGDPDNPDSYLFYGAYPLRITGLEDDTGVATVTENVGDGGWVGGDRKASRSIVFEMMLSGANWCAVEAGFQWLKAALAPSPCNDFGCNGTELCYYVCEPCVGADCTEADVDACAKAHIRTLRNVKVVSAPRVTADRTTSDGAAIRVVSFTLVAGVPFEFGYETLLVEGFMRSSSPWVPDVVPADWAASVTPVTKVDAVCAEPAYEPIIDPECPAVLVPPGPPSIAAGCFTMPEEWERRYFTIPRKYIPYWGNAVPIVKIQAHGETRGLRLRFYADVDADHSVKDDPCSYCGDILFSYIPKDHTLIFDGMTQTVRAEGPGGVEQRADSLVFKTDGTPFEWPVLTCGFGYVVTVDLPAPFTGNFPAIDLSIVGRGS